MLSDPSVTHPNLVKSQISVGSGSVLGGEGRGRSLVVAGESHQCPEFPGSPHLRCFAGLLTEGLSDWGFAFPSFHPEQAAQQLEVK